MKRKVITWLVCVALLFSLQINIGAVAYADEQNAVTAVSAYRTENSLYMFLRLNGTSADTLKFGQANDLLGKASPQRLTDSNEVTYVLLLDASSSMKDSPVEVAGLAETLISNTLWKSRVVIIPFQKTLLEDSVIDSLQLNNNVEEMKSAIGKLKFKDAGGNSSCTAIGQALEYVGKNYPANQGGLVNLVLISDSIDDSASGAGVIKAAKEKIDASPEIIFHTVLFKTDGSVGSRLGGTGLNTYVDELKSGESVANDLTRFVGDIYVVQLENTDHANVRADVELSLVKRADGANQSSAFALHNVPLFAANEDGNGMHIADEQPAEVSDDASTQATTEEGAENSAPPQEQAENNPEEQADTAEPVAEASEPAEADTDEAAASASDDENAETPETDGEESADEVTADDTAVAANDEEDKETKIPLLLIIAISAVVIAVVVLIIVLVARKKRDAQRKANATFIALDVVSGNCKNKKKELYLVDELVIGRDKSCDIVFAMDDVSARNTRVYIKDGAIFIEDLASTNGTRIEGMPIKTPNLLRSGDEIGVGTARFRLLF